MQGKSALEAVLEERQRQQDKWGEQNHSPYYWLGILMEEVGEFSHDLIENLPKTMEQELVQVVAVALAMLECCYRNNWRNEDFREGVR